MDSLVGGFVFGGGGCDLFCVVLVGGVCVFDYFLKCVNVSSCVGHLMFV